jgi:hypothetical protein
MGEDVKDRLCAEIEERLKAIQAHDLKRIKEGG